jgi:hypothetical protein
VRPCKTESPTPTLPARVRNEKLSATDVVYQLPDSRRAIEARKS